MNIPRDEYLRVYQGTARSVLAWDSLGRKISFPVNILQPFISHEGVQGKFRLDFDDQNRFVAIQRIS
ncbi:MAG TPA: DUF2835 domain-containing protein [Pseudomonadales bacterium]|nr:DUF2835 domain-containing protein [Pseudomonadales bacterium]